MVPTIIFKTPTQEQIQHLINEWEKSKMENTYFGTELIEDSAGNYFRHKVFGEIKEIANDVVVFSVNIFKQTLADYIKTDARVLKGDFETKLEMKCFWDFLRTEDVRENSQEDPLFTDEYYGFNARNYYLGDELYGKISFNPIPEYH